MAESKFIYTDSPSREQIQEMIDKNGRDQAAYAKAQAKQAQAAQDKVQANWQG